MGTRIGIGLSLTRALGRPGGGAAVPTTPAFSATLAAVSEQWLSAADGTLLTSAGDWTWAGWLKVTDHTVAGQVLVDENVAVFELYSQGGGGQLVAVSYPSGGAVVVGSGAATVASATWYFVAVSFAAGTTTLALSLDAGTEATAAGTGTMGDPTGWTFGRRGSLETFMSGGLACWGYWTRLLTGPERTTLYNAGAGRTYAGLTAGLKVGLQWYWNMDEAAGATRADSTANGNGLTDHNTVGRGGFP